MREGTEAGAMDGTNQTKRSADRAGRPRSKPANARPIGADTQSNSLRLELVSSRTEADVAASDPRLGRTEDRLDTGKARRSIALLPAVLPSLRRQETQVPVGQRSPT